MAALEQLTAAKAKSQQDKMDLDTVQLCARAAFINLGVLISLLNGVSVVITLRIGKFHSAVPIGSVFALFGFLLFRKPPA